MRRFKRSASRSTWELLSDLGGRAPRAPRFRGSYADLEVTRHSQPKLIDAASKRSSEGVQRTCLRFFVDSSLHRPLCRSRTKEEGWRFHLRSRQPHQAFVCRPSGIGGRLVATSAEGHRTVLGARALAPGQRRPHRSRGSHSRHRSCSCTQCTGARCRTLVCCFALLPSESRTLSRARDSLHDDEDVYCEDPAVVLIGDVDR